MSPFGLFSNLQQVIFIWVASAVKVLVSVILQKQKQNHTANERKTIQLTWSAHALNMDHLKDTSKPLCKCHLPVTFMSVGANT